MDKIYEQKSTGERRTLAGWLPAYEQAADGINADLQPGQAPVTAEELRDKAVAEGDIVLVGDE